MGRYVIVLQRQFLTGFLYEAVIAVSKGGTGSDSVNGSSATL